MKPTIEDAYRLLHEGALALAIVEGNGLRVNTLYLKSAIDQTNRKISHLTKVMRADKIFSMWRKRYGQKTNMGSREQLGVILFDCMGYPCKERTGTGRAKVDEQMLESVDLDFVRHFVQIEKTKRLKSTFLQGISREVVDGYLHPSFNLHMVRTYRSSCDKPNFQNMPIRDPAIGKIVRSCFIPRDGNVLVEIDFSGIEVRVAACYHEDPTMIEYINDKTKDMHRDMAAQCFKLDPKEVTKQIRYCGKNMFVFPQFYGDYYVNCAKTLWCAIERMKLEHNGKSLVEHLKKNGIDRLGQCNPKESPRPGTFEYHIKKVEEDFWGRRFKRYAKWKKIWWDLYLDLGYFDTLTGFRETGVYKRNDVINHPVQGSAFHCLLWSLIRLQKIITKRKMKSLLVGQIHDSIVADVPEEELGQYIQIAQKVMTKDIREHWDWIVVPLEVEAEATPVNTSWFEKKPVDIK
jgi:DNA polymerase-1